MFKSLIDNYDNSIPKSCIFTMDNKYNLDGILYFIGNCREVLTENINYAKFDISLWLDDFLIKYYNNIKYITSVPQFDIDSIINDIYTTKIIKCKSIKFDSDEELDKFFIDNTNHILVLYTICKQINLKTLNISYNLRYADITTKEDLRDYKIDKIIK